ncbi:MAG: homoserine dehydrogenase [Clostridia bacterium]|nr:homoserine dehydrogenase [Clostridia bacterium]
MKTINVAILGFGTVGYGVYRIISGGNENIAAKNGVDLKVTGVLIKSMDEPNVKYARELCTTDINNIIKSDADIVVECIGGDNPAKDFILSCLKAKKHVVTSNKEVIAKHWKELEDCAKENNVGLYIEATVGGGIPIIRTIVESMQGNKIEKVMGIINGTTNYILTKMTDEQGNFDEVLKEAQELGYAEADPKNDVEGYDNMYKLSILGSLAFNTKVPIDKIYRDGISKISPKDIEVGSEFGYVVKMLAIGKREGDKIEVRVHPTMIPKDHPLASVNGVFNAIFLHGDNVDDVMLYGRGAGQLPTASAVVSDVVYAAKMMDNPVYTSFSQEVDSSIDFVSDFKTAAFINITVKDEVGVLAGISKILSEKGVSVAAMVQKHKREQGLVRLIFITHEANEKDIEEAIKQIEAMSSVVKINNFIRVENN